MAILFKAGEENLINLHPGNGNAFTSREFFTILDCNGYKTVLDIDSERRVLIVPTGTAYNPEMNIEVTRLLKKYFEGDAILLSAKEYRNYQLLDRQK